VFAVQSLTLKNLLIFNVYASMAAHGSGGGAVYWTYDIVPSFRLFWGRNRHWSLGAEYYLMNPVYFPFKTLQWVLAQQEFGNLSHGLVTWSFWGISYANRHFRLDLDLASYRFIESPLFPVIGLGWYF
jgi:hypothetical protein